MLPETATTGSRSASRCTPLRRKSPLNSSESRFQGSKLKMDVPGGKTAHRTRAAAARRGSSPARSLNSGRPDSETEVSFQRASTGHDCHVASPADLRALLS